MTLAETVDQYVRLLIIQYRDQPRARATIALLAQNALLDLLPLQIAGAFNVDTAIGVQLDTIGKYVGIPRNIGLDQTTPYFGFYNIGASIQNLNGLQDSTNPAVNAPGIFFQTNYLGSSKLDLNDTAYRLMIKLKIALNQNFSSLNDIQRYLADNLPGYFSLVDNANMTLTYTLLASPPVDPEVIRPYLPRPMGVGLTLVYPTSSAAPTPISQSFPTIFVPSGFIATTTGTPATATPSPAGPALYLWEKISGDPEVEIVSPYTPATQFRATFNSWTTYTATFRCRVTHIPGAFVSYTNNVIVSIQTTP